MKPYYPLVILVVASDNHLVYKKLRTVYERYLNCNPQVKIFLVYGHPITFPVKNHDLYFSDIIESPFPGMIKKTIKAMEYVNNNFNFDFLLRTNISTIWLLDRLLSRISSLPKTNLYTGTRRKCYINKKLTDNYISGTSLIVSRDIVVTIIENMERLVKDNLPEDYVLSNFIDSHLNLKPFNPSLKNMHLLEHLTEFSIKNMEKEIEQANALNVDHFRIKSKNNREKIDVQVASYIVKYYYNV